MTCKSCNMVCMIFLLIILTLVRVSLVYAAFEDLAVGSRYNAYAGACVALADDPEALYINPAGLSQINAYSATLFYARPFGLKELAYGSLSAITPIRNFSVGIGIQNYGNSVYQENTFSFALARQLTQHCMIGATIRYAHLAIKKYGSTGALVLDTGLLLQLSPRWKWGISTRNLNHAAIGQDNEPLPQVFQTGISVKILDILQFNCDAYKDVRFPLDIRCGAEAQPLQSLLVRVGVGTEPTRLAAGMGLLLGKLRWDYAFYTHSDLGLTHLMSVSIFLNS
jgi:hypothetical protein